MTNLPQRRLLPGGGEDEQGTMKVKSCKGDVEMVHPATMTMTATATVPMSSTALNTFAVPSISPLTRFADLSLHSPTINLLASYPSAMQQHPPRDTSSPTAERVRVPAQAIDEPSSASPSA